MYLTYENFKKELQETLREVIDYNYKHNEEKLTKLIKMFELYKNVISLDGSSF